MTLTVSGMMTTPDMSEDDAWLAMLRSGRINCIATRTITRAVNIFLASFMVILSLLLLLYKLAFLYHMSGNTTSGFIMLGFPSSWAAASTLKAPLVTISSPSDRPSVTT